MKIKSYKQCNGIPYAVLTSYDFPEKGFPATQLYQIDLTDENKNIINQKSRSVFLNTLKEFIKDQQLSPIVKIALFTYTNKRKDHYRVIVGFDEHDIPIKESIYNSDLEAESLYNDMVRTPFQNVQSGNVLDYTKKEPFKSHLKNYEKLEDTDGIGIYVGAREIKKGDQLQFIRMVNVFPEEENTANIIINPMGQFFGSIGHIQFIKPNDQVVTKMEREAKKAGIPLDEYSAYLNDLTIPEAAIQNIKDEPYRMPLTKNLLEEIIQKTSPTRFDSDKDDEPLYTLKPDQKIKRRFNPTKKRGSKNHD